MKTIFLPKNVELNEKDYTAISETNKSSVHV